MATAALSVQRHTRLVFVDGPNAGVTISGVALPTVPSVHLVDAALSASGSGQVDIPPYDRGALTAGVVHISVGGFHRAHQAVHFDELARLGETEWGVVGVGLHRPQMGKVLSHQYGLFTVVERGPGGDQVRVIGSLIDYPSDDLRAVVELLANSQTKLVTLTVTGNGYFSGPAGGFDAEEARILHDLEQPETPCTMVGSSWKHWAVAANRAWARSRSFLATISRTVGPSPGAWCAGRLPRDPRW